MKSTSKASSNSFALINDYDEGKHKELFKRTNALAEKYGFVINQQFEPKIKIFAKCLLSKSKNKYGNDDKKNLSQITRSRSAMLNLFKNELNMIGCQITLYKC